MRCLDLLVASPFVLATAAIAVGTGCSGTDRTRPGESLGVFRVDGKLVSTSCGATPDPWAFDVRLRHEQTTLYWVQGEAPVSALVDRAARATLKSSVVQTVRDADLKNKIAACNMARTDVVELVLTPAPTPTEATIAGTTSFKGTLSYRFAATDGSSCEDQLTEAGGDFAVLPCDVKYEITGTRTGDAK